MALNRWFSDWTLIMTGVAEGYKKGIFSIHFSEPRPDNNGINPAFIFSINDPEKTLYSERIGLDLWKLDRIQIMTNIRQKINQYTGLILPDIQLPAQMSQTIRFEDYSDQVFCEAAFDGNLELIELLSKKKLFDVNKIYYKRTSALVYAASAGRYEVVKYLLELKFHPAFPIACDAIRHMSGSGMCIDDCVKGARFHLADNNFLKTVKYLIEKDKETPSDILSHYALGEAMLGDNYELVKVLLTDHRFNPMEGDLHDNFIYPAHRGYYKTLSLIINDYRTDLSRQIEMGWPMISNIEMDDQIKMSLEEAINYAINENGGKTDCKSLILPQTKTYNSSYNFCAFFENCV